MSNRELLTHLLYLTIGQGNKSIHYKLHNLQIMEGTQKIELICFHTYKS